MPDIRYLHTTEYQPSGRQTRKPTYEPPYEGFDTKQGYSVFYPGWIDADTYPWAKDLPPPEQCEILFCPCHRPREIQGKRA